jgi:predicted alpha/beta-hydrolase family hydrolase
MSETRRRVAGVTIIDTPIQGNPAGWRFIYAPGAGSHVNDPFGTYACQTLVARGIAAVRFQFPYQEAGLRRPDRPAVLQETWRAVLGAVREPGVKTVIGGRSMGGRVATLIVSAGAEVDGLVPFAYPLHQPGHPEKARVEHLPAITVPTLFVSGTRDGFGTPEEIAAAADLVPDSTLHILDGADHGFTVLKRSGRSKEEVYAEAVHSLLAWAADHIDA